MQTVIRHSISRSPIGSILVATTDKGLCAVILGDDRATLIRELAERFPGTVIAGADEACAKATRDVTDLVKSPQSAFSHPLHLQGTAFQKSVWQALRKIPTGKTATYLDIARKIGKPRAVRAVAQACGANHIAVVIPCHRVIRTDGSLSGYRWGVERKAKLLEREGVR